MRILAIESSCDETSAAVLEKKDTEIKVLSNITATSLSLHASTGGIIPENAARMQVTYIMPVVIEALLSSNNLEDEKLNNFNIQQTDYHSIPPERIIQANTILSSAIDAISITYGPGLIGSLLVGVETAKTLAYIFQKPLIPVNHLLAHIFANYINRKEAEINYPFVGLIVSGGHTDLLLFNSTSDFEWLGGTRDDAAGEAFDKIGRLIDLPYPAGPEIEKRSSLVSTPSIKFKSPLLHDESFDFSFSGLKTEVLRFVQSNSVIDTNLKNQICYATQKAITDVLVKKTHHAAQRFNARMILVGGGVSANQTFRNALSENSDIPVLFPEKQYSTDNGAMIGAYALINPLERTWQETKANPELYFG